MALSLGAGQYTLSLTDEGEDGTRQIDIPVGAPDEEITEKLSLRQTLGALEREDKKLIYLRYYKELTQTQTAKVLGMTQVQVSRREKKIIEKMRESML